MKASNSSTERESVGRVCVVKSIEPCESLVVGAGTGVALGMGFVATDEVDPVARERSLCRNL